MIRIFDAPFTDEQREAVVAALDTLCHTPLDHPSIAKPLACGVEHGHPYVVHALLEGVTAQAYLAQHGPQPLHEVMVRMTPIAAAIDFAAAAGVHHGALGLADIVIDGDRAGITGFGLLQALHAAMVLDRAPTQADDVRALAAIVFELAHGIPYTAGGHASSDHRSADQGRVQRAFDAVLAPDAVRSPASALALIATLQGSGDDVRAREDDPPLGTPGDQPTMPVSAVESVEPVESLPLEDVKAAVPPMPVSPALFADMVPAPHDSSWRMVTAALCVGLLVGLGGGFLAGRRAAVVAPPSVAVPSPQATSGMGDTRTPAASTGTVSTLPTREPELPSKPVAVRPTAPERSSEVAAAPGVADRPPLTTPRAASASRGRARGEPPVGSRESSRRSSEATIAGTGEVEVVSRPAGAEVFIDGRSVGRTPMLLAISVGRHSIRLHLPRYHEWATTMAVDGGGRIRVAASLEE